MTGEYFTVQEAMRQLGIGRTMLYRLINDDAIRIRKMGRKTYIERASVARYIESRPTTLGKPYNPKGKKGPAGVKCKVEMIPSHITPDLWEKGFHFSRVPCVGELLYTDDMCFTVKTIFHPLQDGDLPLIRVVES